MKTFTFILAFLVLPSCKNDSSESPATSSAEHSSRTSVFDQICVEVRVRRSERGRSYIVTLRNYGSVSIEAYGLVRQQWADMNQDSENRIWQEMPNGHSHAYPVLASGETFERGVDPWAYEDVLLRYGFLVRAQGQEDSRSLIIWSRSINPEMDWPPQS